MHSILANFLLEDDDGGDDDERQCSQFSTDDSKILEKRLNTEGAVVVAAAASASAAASGASSDIVNAQEDASGDALLLTACNDWAHATTKDATGLDVPHVVDTLSQHRIAKTFSSSSSMHSFIITTDDEVYGMGLNKHGQLGLSHSGDGDSDVNGAVRSRVAQGADDKDVEKGGEHVELEPIPVKIPGILRFVGKIQKISTGRHHTLFLTGTGKVFGCGSNQFGQLGLGGGVSKERDYRTPLQVTSVLSSVTVQDIACGYEFSLACDTNGKCYSFGHSAYGQLGHGYDGQHFEEGKRGIQHACEHTPKLIERYVTKNTRGKVISSVTHDCIRIKSVAAGKYHALCLEDWTPSSGTAVDDAHSCKNWNRVYSWGCGGYGRLGHNCADDENTPREIEHFSAFMPPPNQAAQVMQMNAQKQVRRIEAGSTFSLAVASNRVLHFWGQMSNSPRKESTVYPKVVTELADFAVTDISAGSNCIVVLAQRRSTGKSGRGVARDTRSSCIAWGVPVAGKFGYEDGTRTSSAPRVVDGAIADAAVVQDITAVSCGYGHVCYVVNSACPATAAAAAVDVAGTGTGGNSDRGKKRNSSSTVSSKSAVSTDSATNKRQKKQASSGADEGAIIQIKEASAAVRALSSVFPVL